MYVFSVVYNHISTINSLIKVLYLTNLILVLCTYVYKSICVFRLYLTNINLPLCVLYFFTSLHEAFDGRDMATIICD